jgi:hypothetical protein
MILTIPANVSSKPLFACRDKNMIHANNGKIAKDIVDTM